MPATPAVRTLRLCGILSAVTLLFTCVCTYGCAAHTYAHGPLAPETPSDPKTVVWASCAYFGLLLFVIASSGLLLTISSMRRHARMAKKAIQKREALEKAIQQLDLEEERAQSQSQPPIQT